MSRITSLHLHCLPGQGVRIGENVTVTVSALKRGGATLVIEAPRDVRVRKDANLDETREEPAHAGHSSLPQVPPEV